MTAATELDPEHLVLAVAIASGATQAETAQLAGCSERTVRRRLTRPDVQAAVTAERIRLGQEVADALVGRTRAALDRLARVIETGDDRAAVNAARVVLSEARQHRDSAHVLDRLAEVEMTLNRRRDEAS